MKIPLAPNIALALGVGLTAAASGQVSFHRIVGSHDPVPGAPPGTTFSLPFDAQAAGPWVAFGGLSEIGRGIYAWDGHTVLKVVDEITPVPGGGPTVVPYADEGFMDVDAGGSVVFFAENNLGHGIWRWESDGSLELVVRVGDPAPTAPGETVIAVDPPRVWGSTSYAMVSRAGVVPFYTEIIGFPEGETPFLATPPDHSVRPPAFDVAGQLLYRAFDADAVGGLWRADPGATPELLLAPGDPLPGGLPGEAWSGAAASLLRFGLGGAVVGGGGTLGTRGFFAVTSPGEGYALIHHGDPEPRTGQPILQIPSTFASASDQRFAFVAWLADNTRHLSVREPDGTFLPILSTGDVLEGEVVTDIWISTNAFANDNRMVAVIHRQTEAAVWVIDLPPLAGLGPAAIPTLSPIAAFVLALALGVGGSALLRADPALIEPHRSRSSSLSPMSLVVHSPVQTEEDQLPRHRVHTRPERKKPRPSGDRAR